MTDAPIPISVLEHYRYCPRQCALIHVDGVWTDNEHTERGHYGHRRADQPGASRERGRAVLRAVPVHSRRLNIAGRADVIEVDVNGAVTPLEYKIGSRQGDTADVQVCAIALCLEEMLATQIHTAAVWYSTTRRRWPVSLDDDLRQHTEATIEAVQLLSKSPMLPGAPNDERCLHCQLRGHCLPTLTAHPEAVTRYIETELLR